MTKTEALERESAMGFFWLLLAWLVVGAVATLICLIRLYVMRADWDRKTPFHRYLADNSATVVEFLAFGLAGPFGAAALCVWFVGSFPKRTIRRKRNVC